MSTKHFPSLIAHIIYKSDDVQIEDERFIFHCKGQRIPVSTNKLAEYDPRLPFIISYAKYHLAGNTMNMVRYTMEHWSQPETPYGAVSAMYFSKPTYAAKMGDQYVIHARSYRTVCAEGCTIVKNKYPASYHAVNATWMRQYYPQVKHKLDTLETLGIDGIEASTLALETLGVGMTSEALSQIEFD